MRQGMAAVQVVWAVSMIVPGPGAGARLGLGAARTILMREAMQGGGHLLAGAGVKESSIGEQCCPRNMVGG